MSKNILQDVVPPSRKTIRNIPLPEERKKDIEPSRDTYGDVKYEKYSDSNFDGVRNEKRDEDIFEEKPKKGNGHFFAKWGIWLLVLVCLAFLSFAFLTVFSGTVVKVTPKKILTNVNVEIRADRQLLSGVLQYQVLPIVKTKQMSVLADGEKKMEKKARGTIVIYNNYSGATQRLVKGTRFETDKGLIYRIPDSIEVPGKKVQNGKTVLGSIETEVVADSSGPSYNIGLSDFTIPGFKENPPKYTGFFARSKTPMTGGFSGNAKFVTDAKNLLARSKLKQDLEQEILAETKSEVPTGNILFDKAYKITFEDLPNGEDSQGILIQEKAVFTGYIFNEIALSKYLAEQYIDKYDGSPVQIEDLSKLSFNLVDRAGSLPKDDLSILFSLHGSISFIWLFDQDKLKSDLFGKTTNDIDRIMNKYPGILKIRPVIRPFWSSTFPKNSIKIVIEQSQIVGGGVVFGSTASTTKK